MKSYRFYLEHETPQDKRRGVHTGQVIAIIDVMDDDFRLQYIGHDENRKLVCGYECISSLYSEVNSVVCGSSVSRQYLTENCKRISERIARQIHPKLFEWLDYIEKETF
jgi:hypothetical protein